MSQVLGLIVAASVFMMVGLGVMFIAQQGTRGPAQDVQSGSCTSTLDYKCGGADSETMVTVPQGCEDTDATRGGQDLSEIAGERRSCGELGYGEN